jgi:hypothetical protein
MLPYRATSLAPLPHSPYSSPLSGLSKSLLPLDLEDSADLRFPGHLESWIELRAAAGGIRRLCVGMGRSIWARFVVKGIGEKVYSPLESYTSSHVSMTTGDV